MSGRDGERGKCMEKTQNKLLTNGGVVCLLAVISCALWGTAFPGIKIGYSLFEIPSGDPRAQILFAGCRFFLSGVLTVLFGSLAGKKLLKPKKGSWGPILKLCLTQTVLQYLFFYIGLAHASAVKSSIIEGASAFITILLACLFFRQEALTPRKVVGCVLGFAGVVLVNLNGASWDMNMSFLGEGFILLSIVAASISSVQVKNYSRRESPVTLCGYQFICGGFFMAVCGFLSGGRISHVSGQGIAVLVYLAFLSAVAYSIWSILLKYNPVSRVAVWSFTNPIFGVVFSMLLLAGEKQIFGLQTVAALILVSLGIFVVNHAAAPKRSLQEGRQPESEVR
jgi:drug/metabolite transporter (DMT)-like permease